VSGCSRVPGVPMIGASGTERTNAASQSFSWTGRTQDGLSLRIERDHQATWIVTLAGAMRSRPCLEAALVEAGGASVSAEFARAVASVIERKAANANRNFTDHQLGRANNAASSRASKERPRH
jgi:hypothetical protein